MRHVKFLAFVVVLLGVGIFSEFTSANGLPVHNINTTEGFNTIQEAIDDADTISGHTIEVDGSIQATYPEQIGIVDKRLTISGKNNPKITVPVGGTADFHALVIIGSSNNLNQAGGTVFKGFTIDGTDNTATNCDNGIAYGIWVLGTKDVTLSDNTIINVRSTNANASGCQKGIAIGIGADIFTGSEASLNSSSATILRSTISGYQKEGINVSNSVANILDNVITGRGSRDDAGKLINIAQNGINASSNSTVNIHRNTIQSNNAVIGVDESAGIVINCASFVNVGSLALGGNTISGNTYGVGGQAGTLNIVRNTIKSNDYGISIQNFRCGAGAKVEKNTIQDNKLIGLSVAVSGTCDLNYAKANIFGRNGLKDRRKRGIEYTSRGQYQATGNTLNGDNVSSNVNTSTVCPF